MQILNYIIGFFLKNFKSKGFGMKKIFLLSVATGLCFFGTISSFTRAAEEKVVPEPGKQVLMKAELPASLGDLKKNDDSIDPEKKEVVDFWFFMPSDESAKTDEGFPLILFLHGAGERGSDPKLVKENGPAMLCDDPEVAKTWRFITVSPQCKSGRYWSPKQMMLLIDKICAEYPVDRSRVYVTGLSMGGFATWGLAAIGSEKIAAAAPICGWLPPEQASTITIPLWAFHGDADPAVSIDSDRAAVQAAKDGGNNDVAFTVYHGVEHDSWTATYSNPMLYDWFLSKSISPTITGPKPVPGKQVLQTASLPVNIGNAVWGEDEIDLNRKENVLFWLFQPIDDSAKTSEGYPLLLFLHGIGECGPDPKVLKIYGPTKLCDDPKVAKTWKFFTVSPQCKQGAVWSPKQLLILIDKICDKFPIDRSRIYVTGLSLGGMGTWGCAAIGADKIAAVAPVCGLLKPEKAAGITMPVWAFHGADDPIVKLADDQAVVDAVKKAGNSDVKFTVYPGVGHDSWTRAYAEKELYEWLLTKSLKK